MVNGTIFGIFCPLPTYFPTCPNFANSRTGTDLGYGAGVQFKFAAAAVRAEYERVNSSNGSPDMVSLGFTWAF